MAGGLWMLRPQSQDGQSYKGKTFKSGEEGHDEKTNASMDSKRGGMKSGSE